MYKYKNLQVKNSIELNVDMRQLKGKVKETRKQKKERKLENVTIQNQVKTVVLPFVAIFALLIVIFVYFKTRPPVEI